MGWIYYQKGDLEQAEKYLRLAIRDNLSDLETYQHLITVLNEQGKSVEAAEWQERKEQLFPED